MRYAADSRVVLKFYDLITGPSKYLFFGVVALLLLAGIYLPVRDLYIAYRTEDIIDQQLAIRDEYRDAVEKEVSGYLSQEGIEDVARKKLDMVMPGETKVEVKGLDEDGNPIVEESGDAADGGAAADGEDGGAAGQKADPAADDAASDGSGASGEDAGGSGGGSAGKDASEEDNGMLKGSEASDKSKTGAKDEYDPSKKPTTSAEVEAAEQAVVENSPWYWKLLDAVFFFDASGGMAVVSTGE